MGAYIVRSDELYHYGIEGMKWGVRRYQNPDGTLTAAGKERLGRSPRSIQRALRKVERHAAKEKYDMNKYTKKAVDRTFNSHFDPFKKAEKSAAKAKENREKLIGDQKAINQLIGMAAEKGYSTYTKETLGYAHKGHLFLSQFLLGPVGAAAYAAKAYNSGLVSTYKYKVKKTKNGQKPSHVIQMNPRIDNKYRGEGIVKNSTVSNKKRK